MLQLWLQAKGVMAELVLQEVQVGLVDRALIAGQMACPDAMAAPNLRQTENTIFREPNRNAIPVINTAPSPLKRRIQNNRPQKISSKNCFQNKKPGVKAGFFFLSPEI